MLSSPLTKNNLLPAGEGSGICDVQEAREQRASVVLVQPLLLEGETETTREGDTKTKEREKVF